MPHVCESPALSEANVSPPATASGALLLATASPTPSCPPAFCPQQYATPAGVRPHVCDSPALSAANVSPPATATGTVLAAGAPVPSSPARLAPQQNAAPAAVSVQVCLAPASSATK